MVGDARVDHRDADALADEPAEVAAAALPQLVGARRLRRNCHQANDLRVFGDVADQPVAAEELDWPAFAVNTAPPGSRFTIVRPYAEARRSTSACGPSMMTGWCSPPPRATKSVRPRESLRAAGPTPAPRPAGSMR